MNNKTPNFDDEFLTDLHNRLAAEVDETQLQSICSRLDTDYNRLDGQSKQEKIISLITTLRESGQIHELIDVLRSEKSVLDISTVDQELTGKEKRKKRKQRRLERRKRFLRSFFDDKSIAFEEELCGCWEFLATRVHYFFHPKQVKRKITRLSEDFNSISFLDSLERQTKKGSSISEETSEKPKDILMPDEKFVRFHSVRLWYRSIRRDTYPILWLIGLVFFWSIALVGYVGGVLVASSGLDFLSTTISRSEVGLSYTTPVSDTYYLEVKDLESQGGDYFVRVTDSDWLTPDFSEQSIWPISYGDKVLSELNMTEQHLYRIEGDKGDQIVVDIYDWYANSDLNFVLLDAQMNPIDVELLSSDSRVSDTQLEYLFDSSEMLYLRVQMPKELSRLPLSFPSLSLSSPYGFWVYKFIGDTNQEIEGTAVPIMLGSVMKGHLDKADRSDRYYFAAQAGKSLHIRVNNLSDSPYSSLTLYRLTEEEPVVIAHSNRLTITESVPYLSTAYGRSFVIAFLLDQVGFSVDPAEIEQPYIWYIYFILMLFILAFAVYAFFIRFLAVRKYEESFFIHTIIDVLLLLEDDTALNCESKKASIRSNIKLAVQRIQEVHKISRFPPLHAPPDKLRYHLAKIASQIRQMNKVVSMPTEGDLSLLRRRFVNWLAVLLKAEYGRFQFSEDFEMKAIPWHREFMYSIQRYRWLLISLTLLLPLALWLTRSIWEEHTASIIDGTWLATRYAILIVTSYMIYYRWGPKGPSEQQKYKWEHVVRLILSFFVPLIGLDVLLQTGIIESILKLIGNLKGIF